MLTFNEFVQIVKSNIEAAAEAESCEFRDESMALRSKYKPDRIYYFWEWSKSAVEYDSDSNGAVWRVTFGRGAIGYGFSIQEAITNEAKNYYYSP